MALTNTDRPNIFSSARTLCAHQSEHILSDRGYIDLLTGSLTSAQAGAMVWSQAVKNEEDQLHFWETAVAEIESALSPAQSVMRASSLAEAYLRVRLNTRTGLRGLLSRRSLLLTPEWTSSLKRRRILRR